VAYIVLGFAGWWQWLHGGPERSRLIVETVALADRVAWLQASCADLQGVTVAGVHSDVRG
jgi:hypothetical protein